MRSETDIRELGTMLKGTSCNITTAKLEAYTTQSAAITAANKQQQGHIQQRVYWAFVKITQ